MKYSPFGYSRDINDDTFYYDPSHPNFADYDFRIAFTHELAHRIDRYWVHSIENAEFSKAIADAAAIVDSRPEFFLSYCKKHDKDGFLSDILDAMCESKYDFPTGHDYEYWQHPGKKIREIFSNLFSLETFRDTQKWIFLMENFPALIRAYLNFEYHI